MQIFATYLFFILIYPNKVYPKCTNSEDMYANETVHNKEVDTELRYIIAKMFGERQECNINEKKSIMYRSHVDYSKQER